MLWQCPFKQEAVTASFPPPSTGLEKEMPDPRTQHYIIPLTLADHLAMCFGAFRTYL